MFALLMLQWWYGQGWVWLGKKIISQLDSILQDFSAPTLLRTLFAPWKQIQSQKSLNNFLQASLDNFISRFIGATVRILMLIAALVSSLLILIFGMLALLIWPLLPLSLIYLPFIALFSDLGL